MKSFALETAKIVGTTDSSFWSQNHLFLPGDKEKRLLFGQLLASFSLKAKGEKLAENAEGQPEKQTIDIPSFGKEIISRFHEIYYSSPEKNVLLRLKSSLEALMTEFSSQVELQATAGVVIKGGEGVVGYFALLGKGKVVILRNDQLVTILTGIGEEIKTASGYLRDGDLVTLATQQFFEAIDNNTLKASLTSGQVGQAVESLAPVIHGRKDNSQTAAIVFKIKVESETVEPPEKKEEETPQPVREETEEKPRKKVFANFAIILKNIPFLAKKFLIDFKSQPRVFIRDKGKRARAKKTTLSVAFILIALLLVSIILGSKRKFVLKESQKAKDIFSEGEYKYQQAVSLVELNPLRARSLLNEAKKLIEEGEKEVQEKEEKEKLSGLLKQIETELERAAKEYRLETGEVFLDLGLAKEGFKGDDWDFSEDSLQVLDKEKNTTLEVKIENKAAKVSAGGEKLEKGEKVGASQGRIFVLKKGELVVIDADKGEVIDSQEGKDWGEIIDLVGFGGNAYLLDAVKGTIWKYVRTDKGFSSPSRYLKAESLDFKDSVSLGIDGSVWLLFSDGTIIKFTRGVRDAFLVSGLDKEFKEPEKIYTDENLDNLYILDRKNTRVVVISKDTGEYQAQYIWPGIAGAIDIFASEEEGKILLLTGERIYQIDLKS
jgi:hypothetical protein